MKKQVLQGRKKKIKLKPAFVTCIAKNHTINDKSYKVLLAISSKEATTEEISNSTLQVAIAAGTCMHKTDGKLRSHWLTKSQCRVGVEGEGTLSAHQV